MVNLKSLSIKTINKKPEYQFGLRKEVKFNGENNLIPIFRQKKLFSWSSWSQIVKIYDTYRIMDFDGDVNLTEDECLTYIQEFKKIIDEGYSEKIQTVEILSLEDDKINSMIPVSEEKTGYFSKFKNMIAQLF